MAKFFLGIAIIAFTTFCGYLLTKKYRRRKLFFTQLYAFNERFLNEIAYYRRPIAEFTANFAYRGEFGILLNDYFASVEDFQAIFIRKMEKDIYDFLKKEEKRSITDYFSMLGKGDSQSQKTYFSSIKEMLLKQRNEAEAENKKFGDLYIKLGFLCGLFILILII